MQEKHLKLNIPIYIIYKLILVKNFKKCIIERKKEHAWYNIIITMYLKEQKLSYFNSFIRYKYIMN